MNRIIVCLMAITVVFLPIINGTLYSHVFRSQWSDIIYAIIVAVILSVGIIYSIRNRSTLQIKVPDVLFFLYCIWTTCHALFVNPVIYDPAHFLDGLVLLAFYCVFKQYGSIKQLLYMILISGVIQSLLGIAQFADVIKPFNSLHTTTGTFINPSLLGCLLSLSILAGLSLYGESRNRIMALLISIVCIGLIVSNSRAAWLSTLVGIMVMYSCRLKIAKWTKRVLIASITTLVIVGLYFYRPDSANGRLLVWRVTTEIIKEMPIIGNGADSFRTRYLPQQAEYLANNPREKFAYTSDAVLYPFNELLAVLCKYGVVGAILIVMWVVVMLIYPDRSTRALISAFIVFSLFSYPTESLALTVIFVALASRVESRTLLQIPGIYSYISLALLVISVWLTIVSYRFYVKYSHGIINKELLLNQDYILSESNQMVLSISSSREAVEILQKQIKIAPYCNIIMRLSQVYESIGDSVNATKYARQACDMVPSRLSPKHRLMRLYSKYDYCDSAKVIATEILDTPIKIASAEADSIVNDARQLLTE